MTFTDEQVLQAMRELERGRISAGITATEIAYKLRIEGARRHGSGATKGSWSGFMAPALRIAPRLRSMVKRELLWERYDFEYHRRLYHRMEDGRII